MVCAKFINRSGTVTLAYVYPGDPFMGEDTGFYPHSLPLQAGVPHFPMAVERTKLPVFGDHGEYPPPPQLTFAHWSLLLAYLLLWMLASYWRRRQVRKAS
jgi:heme A synthase